MFGGDSNDCGCHVVVCHSGACGQSRQRGLCYIVRVCEIQVLSVDACDATNGLDVGSRYNFESELFELG